jgi:uncharacterized OsmC-like protein
MDIHQLDHTQLLLSNLADDQLNTSLEHPSLYLGAISLFVASLGRCTFAVLREYAMRLEVPVKNIHMDMYWTLATGKTNKIESIELAIYWPEIPENRMKAVERASHKCTVHGTISDCVDIKTSLLKQAYQKD